MRDAGSRQPTSVRVEKRAFAIRPNPVRRHAVRRTGFWG